MIKSVYGTQTEILQGIMSIYGINFFDADVSYSKGNFYKQRIPQPRFKFDLVPQTGGVVAADFTQLPLASSTLKSVVFDPPFLTHAGKQSKIGNRFSSYKNYDALMVSYQRAIKEIYRVLVPQGICVMKCQDIVSGGKNRWWHVLAFQWAAEVGFNVDDLYILTTNTKMIGNNWKNQKHAHKYHSYFWVFQKG